MENKKREGKRKSKTVKSDAKIVTKVKRILPEIFDLFIG